MDRVNADSRYYFDDSYFFSLMESNDFKAEIIYALDNVSKGIVSAAMMIKSNAIIQYHLSGTKNEYLNFSPIRLLIDEARIKGSDENLVFFNLGGGLGNKEDELFRFKSSFSKDFKTFDIWRCILNTKIYEQLNSAITIEKETDFFPLYRYSK